LHLAAGQAFHEISAPQDRIIGAAASHCATWFQLKGTNNVVTRRNLLQKHVNTLQSVVLPECLHQLKDKTVKEATDRNHCPQLMSCHL
jgi:hypothetical protein